jgi:hypothetical protein
VRLSTWGMQVSRGNKGSRKRHSRGALVVAAVGKFAARY